MAVTVLIVTKNRQSFVAFIVSRLLSILRFDDEIVLIDDGSEIPITLPASSPQIRLIRHDHSVGQVPRRNQGVVEARNECILQLDDDAWPVERDCLDSCERAILLHGAVGAFALPIHYHWAKGTDECGRRDVRWDGSNLQRDVAFMGCGAIIRRSAFLKAGGYPDYCSHGYEESVLSMRLHRCGYQVRFLNTLRIIHGHEILCDADQYRRTRSQYRRAPLYACERCCIDESYPTFLGFILNGVVWVRSLRDRTSWTEITAEYRIKARQMRSDQRLTALQAASWLGLLLVSKSQRLICRIRRSTCSISVC